MSADASEELAGASAEVPGAFAVAVFAWEGFWFASALLFLYSLCAIADMVARSNIKEPIETKYVRPPIVVFDGFGSSESVGLAGCVVSLGWISVDAGVVFCGLSVLVLSTDSVDT